MAKEGRGGGAKKYGRNKRKAAAKSGAMSRYVRGKISFDTYAKAANVKRPKRG